jgi:ssDNA-binding Zn-finger/Zn-ribbon topoisomerase 1
VYDKSRYYCVLRCSQCGERTFITGPVANDIKAVYKIRCHECGSDMKARKKRGARALSFFGCTNYPACHGLVDFKDLAIERIN